MLVCKDTAIWLCYDFRFVPRRVNTDLCLIDSLVYIGFADSSLSFLTSSVIFLGPYIIFQDLSLTSTTTCPQPSETFLKCTLQKPRNTHTSSVDSFERISVELNIDVFSSTPFNWLTGYPALHSWSSMCLHVILLKVKLNLCQLPLMTLGLHCTYTFLWQLHYS